MATSERTDPHAVVFADAAAFEAWLGKHTADSGGLWLKIAKKGTGIASITDDEAVDVGLCFGWISGQRKPLDSEYYLQKYVPRRPRSRWSQVNVRKVERLTAEGRMRPAGIAEVEAAKADGRWESGVRVAARRHGATRPRPRPRRQLARCRSVRTRSASPSSTR